MLRLRVVALKLPRLNYGDGVGRSFPKGKSWRTRRTARRKRDLPELLFILQPPLSYGLSLSKSSSKV